MNVRSTVTVKTSGKGNYGYILWEIKILEHGFTGIETLWWLDYLNDKTEKLNPIGLFDIKGDYN